MKKKLLYSLILLCSYFSYGQLSCPTLTSPIDGQTNVAVDATITWNAIVGAPGYLISIGTTPGGTEIINNLNVGNATSFTPPLGLPENEDIYVTLTIFFFNSPDPDIVCPTEMFSTEDITTPPNCTTERFPLNMATNVNVGTAIGWNYATGATGYRISIGTTLGGTDIVNDEDVGNTLTYQPAADFDFDTEIFVTLIPYNDNGPTPNLCPQYSFTTGSMATLPGCTEMLSPIDGAINVDLSPLLEWRAVPGATGYRVTVGTTPFNANVIDNLSFPENSTRVVEFEPNLTFFITIVPFNDAGEAIGCQQESFSTILGCGPFFDSITNELVDLKPVINFPDTISFCRNETPMMVSSMDTAEGVRWYQLDQNDNETLLSTDSEIMLSEEGRYKYEAFNTVSQAGITIECPNSKVFTVVSSEIATELSLNATGQNGSFNISVQNSGSGDYEYAIDQIDGAYQDSPNFNNVAAGFHTFYVRDKNGCGIAEIDFEQDLTLEGFPKFFTPNGDGVNDFWQVLPPIDGGEIQVDVIEIFDRFGALLVQIDPTSRGWDGRFNGRPLPSSDYWFKAYSLNNNEIQGHFSLKR